MDDFTRHLWSIYETVKQEGFNQPISLGIFRNDYMLDTNKQENKNNQTILSQIELNTISCSFGAATSQVTRLHKYLLNATHNQTLIEKQPINDNANFLAKSIIEAWRLYGNKKYNINTYYHLN